MSVPEPFARYLGLLGLAAGPPDLEHLNALVAAQLMRVPFENISKLHLKKRSGATSPPTLEEHLDGIERFRFGGTCYANNPHFFALLRQLGYDAALCGADMSRPDVHVVTIVRLGGREHLVDVGYGAPFYAALPRDLASDFEIPFGDCRYILKPQDEAGRSRLTALRGDGELHGYLAKPAAREIGHFRDVMADSYRETSTFMNAVVVARFFPGRSVRIHNLSLTESTAAGATTTPLEDRDALIQAIEAHAGIPADIVREATEGVRLDGDIYG